MKMKMMMQRTNKRKFSGYREPVHPLVAGFLAGMLLILVFGCGDDDTNTSVDGANQFDANGQLDAGDRPDATELTDASIDAGALSHILNGSFEDTTFEPGCHNNLTNAEFNAGVTAVTAFGAFNQIDLYTDCYGSQSTDGLFHVGLGADDLSDGIALTLSGPLVAGQNYEVRFDGKFGQTYGATSTNVQVGVSSDPNDFGTLVGQTGQLPSDYAEHVIAFSAPSEANYITMQVEVDGDLGWAMIDDVRLESAN